MGGAGFFRPLTGGRAPPAEDVGADQVVLDFFALAVIPVGADARPLEGVEPAGCKDPAEVGGGGPGRTCVGPKPLVDLVKNLVVVGEPVEAGVGRGHSRSTGKAGAT